MSISIKKLFMTKKVVVVGAAVAVALGAGTAAFAYFSSTGSATGTGSVGTATTWGVVASPESGTMYPGVGTATIPFTITNNGGGNQAYTSLTATLGVSNGDITSGGIEVVGCLASWFTAPIVATQSVADGTSIIPTGTSDVTVTLTMNDSLTNQDACKLASPDVTLSVK